MTFTNRLELIEAQFDGTTRVSMWFNGHTNEYHVYVECTRYDKHPILVAKYNMGDDANRGTNEWIGKMAADLQPNALKDVVSNVVYTRKW